MVTAVIHHRVGDYEKWRSVYSSNQVAQESFGVTREEIFRSVDDPNMVIVRLDFQDKRSAEAFLTSDPLKQKMIEASVDLSSFDLEYIEAA
jgi:hypothetical protein